MSARRTLASPKRRQLCLGAAALGVTLGVDRLARAFGDEGAFNPRILITGLAKWEGVRATAPARWSKELVTRTSAPARQAPTTVRADDPTLLAEPFAVWGGDADPAPLTDKEVLGLRRFVALGGTLFVDEFAPEKLAFHRGAKREIARIIPEGAPVAIGEEHVVFRDYYFLRRAVGRVEGPPKLEAIIRSGTAQVIFSQHDLLGALARSAGDVSSLPVTPGGEEQREHAVRFAVNIAMYVLCSNYKDDQVHAPFLMRKRGPERP